jgi:cyanoexosortase A
VIDSFRGPASQIRERWLFWVAAVVGAAQTALGARLEAATSDYWPTVGAAWVGVLFVLWERRAATALRSALAWRLLGAAAVVVSLGVLARSPAYRAPDRVLPLLAGLGLFLAASGLGGWWRERTPLLLLGLPVMNPLPEAIRNAVAPTQVATWFAMMIGRAFGYPMTADGTILRVPGGTLDVLNGCSGVVSVSRLFVLAVLVVALFPTNARQRVALFASAVLVGFLVNAARVAVLGVAVAGEEEARFAFWHDGLGATAFSTATTVLAGIVWWLALMFLAPRFEEPQGHVAVPARPGWFDRESPAASRARPH